MEISLSKLHIIKPLVKRLLYLPHLPFDFIYCVVKGLKYQKDWVFRGWPLFQRVRGAQIEIGSNFLAVSRSRFNSWGIIQPVAIKALRKGAVIKIGSHVGMSGCTLTAIEKITIGDKVLIGSGAVIADNDAHPIHPEKRLDKKHLQGSPVTIKNNVFIGARSLILKGVTVGEGAVIGAGSIVVSDVPDYAVVVGVPAKIIGDSRTY